MQKIGLFAVFPAWAVVEGEHGRECGTLRGPSLGLPPTRWVGKSGVRRSGRSASRGAEFVHSAVVMGVGPGVGAEDVVEVLVVAEGVDAVLGESSMRCWGEVDIVADYRKIGVVR